MTVLLVLLYAFLAAETLAGSEKRYPFAIVLYDISGIDSKAVCDAADVQLHFVIGIFLIKLPVEAQLAVVVRISRYSCQIAFAVQMDAFATGRVFRIAVKSG